MKKASFYGREGVRPVAKKKKKSKKKVKPTKKGGPEEFKAGLSGRKIRSKGKGLGKGYGAGRGPRGRMK